MAEDFLQFTFYQPLTTLLERGAAKKLLLLFGNVLSGIVAACRKCKFSCHAK
jgi:hypothetical protein